MPWHDAIVDSKYSTYRYYMYNIVMSTETIILQWGSAYCSGMVFKPRETKSYSPSHTVFLYSTSSDRVADTQSLLCEYWVAQIEIGRMSGQVVLELQGEQCHIIVNVQCNDHDIVQCHLHACHWPRTRLRGYKVVSLYVQRHVSLHCFILLKD